MTPGSPVDSGAGLRGSPIEVAWRIIATHTPGLRAHSLKLLVFLLNSAMARNSLVIHVGRRRVMRYCGLCRKGYDRARKDIARVLPVIVGLRGSPLTYDLRALWAVGLQGSPVPQTPGLQGSPLTGIEGENPVTDQIRSDLLIRSDQITTSNKDTRNGTGLGDSMDRVRSALRTLKYLDGKPVYPSDKACGAALSAAGGIEQMEALMPAIRERLNADHRYRPQKPKSFTSWIATTLKAELENVKRGTTSRNGANGHTRSNKPDKNGRLEVDPCANCGCTILSVRSGACVSCGMSPELAALANQEKGV